MANLFVIASTAALLLFVVQLACTTGSNKKRTLTPDEQVMADEARSEIAQILERNLIKFFTLVAADNGRELFGRQDEDEEEAATLNPQVLPQVAQILGAIFGGGLNISKIVDQSFTFATDTIKTQVDGVFKLLTGQELNPTTTTTVATTPKPRRRKTTPHPEDYDLLTTEKTTTTTRKGQKYSIRNNNRTRATVPPVRPFDYWGPDEEILYSLEQEVISAAIDAEPYVRDREPRFIAASVREILANFDSGRLNLTQVIRFLPDLFVGARQAFTLLENLGQLAGIDLDDD